MYAEMASGMLLARSCSEESGGRLGDDTRQKGARILEPCFLFFIYFAMMSKICVGSTTEGIHSIAKKGPYFGNFSFSPPWNACLFLFVCLLGLFLFL
jgi:hypothetical protein